MSNTIEVVSKGVIKAEMEIVSDSESETEEEESDSEEESNSEENEKNEDVISEKEKGESEEDYEEDFSAEFSEDTRLLTYANVPHSFDELDYNPDVTTFLKAYSAKKNIMPHLIINGSGGSGKLTRLRCMLRDIYGEAVFKIVSRVMEMKISNGSSTKTIVYNFMEGTYHFEIEPHLYSSNDKYVIQDFIKRLSDYDNLVTNSVTFIIVKSLDKLSFLAQQGLRRLMELKMLNIRLLFTSECLNKITPAILSRCYVVMNPSVSVRTGCKILRKISEDFDIESDDENKRDSHICKISNNGLSGYTNLGKAICNLQSSYSSGKYVPPKVSFHFEIEALYLLIVVGKSLGFVEVQKIRDILYRLYIELVDFRNFLIIFVSKCKESKAILTNLKYHKLLHLVADTDEKLNCAVKPTLPMENFCYKLFWLVHYE